MPMRQPTYDCGKSGAINRLTALGIGNSYQNEGDVFEMNWQQACTVFVLYIRLIL